MHRSAFSLFLGVVMIEVVFMACSLVIGPVCQEQRLVFAQEPGSLTSFQCSMYGQFEMAKWAIAHPNWRIAPGGYKCRPAGIMAKI